MNPLFEGMYCFYILWSENALQTKVGISYRMDKRLRGGVNAPDSFRVVEVWDCGGYETMFAFEAAMKGILRDNATVGLCSTEWFHCDWQDVVAVARQTKDKSDCFSFVTPVYTLEHAGRGQRVLKPGIGVICDSVLHRCYGQQGAVTRHAPEYDNMFGNVHMVRFDGESRDIPIQASLLLTVEPYVPYHEPPKPFTRPSRAS